MKYLFLLWQDPSAAPTPGSAEMNAEFAAYGAVYDQLTTAGAFQAGDPLQPAATGQTVRVRNGGTEASKGSFTDGAEQLIGFYVVECKDDADAATWAAKIPAAAKGAVEVRPVLSM